MVQKYVIMSSMTRESSEKLNFLLKSAPDAGLLTARYLQVHGISSKLAWWYVQSGWLERVADGVYKLAGASIKWPSVPHALLNQLELPVHVGGKTALELLGKSHYLPMGFGQQAIQLFSPAGVKLPEWVNSSDSWKEQFKLYSTKMFAKQYSLPATLITRVVDGVELMLSSPERAALEICYGVPKVVSFAEAAQCFEGLTRLRPNVVQPLLENCQHIKAKRLFLYFSERYQHEWLNVLDMSKVNLGKGKRVIAGGGVFNKKYSIAVPKLNEDEGDDEYRENISPAG